MVGCDATRAEMVVSDEDFLRLMACVGLLSHAQLAALNRAIEDRPGAARALPETVPETAAEAAGPACPYCQSEAVGRWGSANGMRRYRCKPCNVALNCLTGTPLAQLHKRELWGEHAQALVDGISLRKVADRIGVHVETAFRWRHRVLKAPKALKAKVLDGTVAADETTISCIRGRAPASSSARHASGVARLGSVDCRRSRFSF